jgi:hypothetical protein
MHNKQELCWVVVEGFEDFDELLPQFEEKLNDKIAEGFEPFGGPFETCHLGKRQLRQMMSRMRGIRA